MRLHPLAPIVTIAYSNAGGPQAQLPSFLGRPSRVAWNQTGATAPEQTGWSMNVSEFDESFDDDEKRVQGAILTQPLSGLLRGPPVTVPATATLQHAVRCLQERHIGCLLVVGDDKKLLGIFTERDILNRVVGSPVDLANARVVDHMTAKPETLTPNDKVAWALNKMHEGGFRHVPIVDAQNSPVGLLSVKDIVDFIVELFPAAVLNLPPDPTKEARVLDGG